MTMELNIDFVAYMWVIGILMVLVAVVACIAVVASLRRHDRRHEEAKANSRSLNTWDGESPNSFDHR